MGRALPLAILTAVVLAGASPASARGPSTEEQASLDWILLRFAADREEEKKGTGAVDEIVAFERGETSLNAENGGWKRMMDIIMDPSPTVRAIRRENAAEAIRVRFRLEEERRALDSKTLTDIKYKVCRETYGPKGMLSPDKSTVVLSCIHKVHRALLPADWVTWTPSDSLPKRREAQQKLKERLR
jgi:hypothetical protein